MTKSLVNILWAYAAVNHKHDGLMMAGARTFVNQMTKFNKTADVSMLAWSFAAQDTYSVAQKEGCDLWKVIRRGASRLGFPAKFKPYEQHAIGMAATFVGDASPAEQEMVNSGGAGDQHGMMTIPRLTASARCVIQALQGVPAARPYKVVGEYCVPGVGLVDIAFPELKLAIEVDGPTHHVRPLEAPLGTLGHGCGSDALRRALMQKAGWSAVHISVAEWGNIRPDMRVAYLRQLLEHKLVNSDEANKPKPAFKPPPPPF